jgi:hypothetical protein
MKEKLEKLCIGHSPEKRKKKELDSLADTLTISRRNPS